MASFLAALAAAWNATASGAAPAQCTTAITLSGLGVQGGLNFDTDYYWRPSAFSNRYEAVITDDWWGTLSVGCQPHCDTPEQTAMAKGKWALVNSGNNAHFGENQLLAVCSENCPPVSEEGPSVFVPPSSSRWSKYGGGEVELHAECCKRKADMCDSCDEGSCRAQTAYTWVGGLPNGCGKGASSCCYNNHDNGEFGHCGCKPVATVCDHGITFLGV